MKKIYILFLLCSFVGFSQSPGDIVITEIMKDPSFVSDTYGEWFEVYNTTVTPIDLNNWVIRDQPGTSQNLVTIIGSVIVPAGGYITLGKSGVTDPMDAAYNGGVTHDYVYDSTFVMFNASDEVILDAPDGVGGFITIDEVFYTDADFPDVTGVSFQLDPGSLTEVANDTGSNWCESTTSYGGGDLGTPATVNVVCPSCVVAFDCTHVICEAFTAGSDTYTASIEYSGGNVGTTFAVTATAGTVSGGDDPSTVATGTIIVTGIPEGTDITVTLNDTAGGGACNVTSSPITSPTCNDIGSIDLELIGVMDFDIGSTAGKAVHLYASANIPDLSVYGVGSANNGGGTDGEEFTLPNIAVNSGDHILVARNLAAMETYLTTAGYNLFTHKIEDATPLAISQNGDDAIELFKSGEVIEIFGDACLDGTGLYWDYLESWAYKPVFGTQWLTNGTYGGPNCTDGSTTSVGSSCLYPFLASLSTNELSKSEFSIFPNPVNDGLVTINSTLSGVKNVELFDLTGRTVLKTQLNSDILDVRSLNAGLYLLKVSIDSRTATKKIIIK